MDAVRKAYHRAVQILLDNVERLWQEIEAFETALHKITIFIYLKSCITFLTEYIHGGSFPRPHASPHRPSTTPKAPWPTFPTSSTINAHQTSPVLTVVTHFQTPGESVSQSVEILPEMGGK
jgi:hypothetical protein